MLVDTHTHIHEADFPAENLGGIGEVLARASAADVKKLVLVGTSVMSSRAAVDFAQKWDGLAGVEMRVAVGIHPHEADPELEYNLEKSVRAIENLLENSREKIVAIGEIGLDYFYDFPFRAQQISLLKMQLDLAKKFALPVNFHIRDPKIAQNNVSVWRDFWPAYDAVFAPDFSRNILHSYTEQSRENLAKALARNLNFGVNGISTFAKKSEQNLWRELPISRVIFETDAPFLSPSGFRGQPNEPARIREIAEHFAGARGLSLDEISAKTTENAARIYRF